MLGLCVDSSQSTTAADASYYDLHRALSEAREVGQIRSVASRAVQLLGLRSFAACFFGPACPQPLTISSFPDAWNATYAKMAQGTAIFEWCRNSALPIVWWTASSSAGQLRPELSQFMAFTRESGLNAGVTVPLHCTWRKTWGWFSAGEPGELEASWSKIRSLVPHLTLFGCHVFSAVHRHLHGSDSQKDLLTSQETKCLELCAKGASNKMIARALNISESTAVFHIRNVLSKLRVRNRTEAVSQYLLASPMISQESDCRKIPGIVLASSLVGEDQTATEQEQPLLANACASGIAARIGTDLVVEFANTSPVALASYLAEIRKVLRT